MEPFGRFLNVIDVEATCWPKRPPEGQVSAFCTELTGLTQEEADTGVGFAEAWTTPGTSRPSS
jgi:hypothetical protein